MKRPPTFLFMLGLVAWSSVLAAPPADGVFRNSKQIVDGIPRATWQAMASSGARAPEAMKQANDHLRAEVHRKTATFKIKVEAINPAPGGQRGTQVKVANDTLRESGTSMTVHLWVYIPDEDKDSLAKLKKGSEATVTGTLSRVDFTTANNGVHLNLDLEKAKVE